MATRIITFSVLLFTLITFGFSQELTCGTLPTQKDVEGLKSLKIDPAVRGRMADGDPIFIAITAHILRRSDGTGGLTEEELTSAIEDVNQIYTLTNMTFFLLGDINYIDDDAYFDFDASDEGVLTSAHDVPNTINVYFFNTAVSDGSSLCGYAYFPTSGIDHLVMVNNCTTNGSTFPHELGHYFSLYHTHGKTNTGTTDELVDGSNCTTAGDDLCDTAADPNLSGKVSGACVYTGTDVDANGDTYDPNPKNLMSYSQKHCRDEFSQGQADRIATAYQQFKTYLLSSNYTALFDVTDKEICEGEEIAFTNKSVGATSYEWIFEGGTPAVSTDSDPIVTYHTPGEYDVTLTITVADGETDTKVLTDYIFVKGEVVSAITQKDGSFEEPATEELIINGDGGITFTTTTEVASDGNQSMFMDFLNYSASGQEDYLVLSALNSSVEKTFVLTFDYAYAPYDDTYFDGLAVVQRDPCGEWVTVWEKFGSELQTRPAQVKPFNPLPEDWKTETLTINIPLDQDVTEVAFKAINGYGNNLYIDNYDIGSTGFSFSITDVVITDASCPDTPDGEVSVQTSRVGNFQYSTDGATYGTESVMTGLLPGTYEVYTKNEIDEVKSESIVVGYANDYPMLPEIILSDGELTIIEEAGTTIQWSYEGNLLDGENSTILAATESGSYTVDVTIGSCTVTSEPFVILAVHEIESSLELYPNPATHKLNINLPLKLRGEVKLITIRELTGKVIKAVTYQGTMDVSQLNSGMYLLELSGEDFVVSRRFLKR
ncbi:MAG: zinc-dependent metalloprotease [Cyclobacteriaceae bacterium]